MQQKAQLHGEKNAEIEHCKKNLKIFRKTREQTNCSAVL